jgi:hypothetical protein
LVAVFSSLRIGLITRISAVYVISAVDRMAVGQVFFRVKIKESRNRPGVAQRVPVCLGSQIS